jgi:hypothetical protein
MGRSVVIAIHRELRLSSAVKYSKLGYVGRGAIDYSETMSGQQDRSNSHFSY